MHSEGLEPPTFPLEAGNSVLLSYECNLAKIPGIEPGLMGLEAIVLPLHHIDIRIGTPSGIRTHNLRVLSATPLPVGLQEHIGTSK